MGISNTHKQKTEFTGGHFMPMSDFKRYYNYVGSHEDQHELLQCCLFWLKR